VARKRVAKKLKVTKTTSQEVSSSSSVIEYLSKIIVCSQLNSDLSQEIPSSDPVDQGEGDDWDTVGEPTERSRSPAPTVEELVSQMTRQTSSSAELQAPAEESRLEPSTTTGVGELVAAQAEEEAPAEAGLVDIASILGTPTVTVVLSSL
jgi:hypothetical protein